MKKVLSFLLLSFLAVVITVGFLVFDRYKQNSEQIVPYPYSFAFEYPGIKVEAPILLIGDRMGSYLTKFKVELADTISVNLSSPIKIESLAKDGQGLHRTLHQLKSLTKWPQILIYQGASEETFERKFELAEISKISQNFKRFKNDKLETLMVLYPWISRLVYEPVKKVVLQDGQQPREEITEEGYLKSLETELMLFEEHLIQLVSLSKDRNSLLILTTTPINLDIAPKKVCDFTSTREIDNAIEELRNLLKENNPKTAYAKSSKLIKQYSANPLLFYIHGQISKRLGLIDEGRKSLLKASAFDCNPWRATEVYNSMIRKIANEHQVLLFDFAKMVEKDWGTHATFFDEIHPQHLYYEKAVEQLGLVIKNILKL